MKPREKGASAPGLSAFSAQKSHVKPQKPPNPRITTQNKHKQNDLQEKNKSGQSGILVMPDSLE
jgi:hypothetical protein